MAKTDKRGASAPLFFAIITGPIMEEKNERRILMKTFVIIVETALLSFILGAGWGASVEERKYKQMNNDTKTDEETA